jgi:hypothetical protein
MRSGRHSLRAHSVPTDTDTDTDTEDGAGHGFESRVAGMTWLDAEAANLMAVVQWADEDRHAPSGIGLALDLGVYHGLRARRRVPIPEVIDIRPDPCPHAYCPRARLLRRSSATARAWIALLPALPMACVWKLSRSLPSKTTSHSSDGK